MFFKELLIVFKNLKLTNSLPYEAKTSVIFQLLLSLVEELRVFCPAFLYTLLKSMSICK